MYQIMAIMAAFVFVYSITGGGLARTPLNGAVVYTAFGLIFGPIGIGFLDLDVGREGLNTLAEVTLALVLFTDAANTDLKVLRRSYAIPQRLLLIGLPLTILFGFGAGVLLFDSLTLMEAAILATMLAPTDAALGAAVVTNPSVPADIREGLNVESGLNDGICVPILLLFLVLAAGANIEGGSAWLALKLVTQVIGLGIVVGIGLTFIGHHLFEFCAGRGWVTETWQQLPAVAMAIVCFAVAQLWGGSGFIACFTGGLLAGGLARRKKHKLLLTAEGAGDTLALITWVVFGAAVVGQHFSDFNWRVVLYAVCSLTIVRIIPVFISLGGMKLPADEKLFMGWFGPRGLASIVFAVIVINKHLPGGGTITIAVVCTIALSIVAHGLSANPFIAALADRRKPSASTVKG